MTNLQAFNEQIQGDIQRFKTAVRFATGTDEEKAQANAESYAILDGQVALTRGHYAEYREKTIEEKKKSAAIFNLNLTGSNIARAKTLADKYFVELIGASDTASQNVVLNELVAALKYFEDGDKVAFFPHVSEISDQLFDKAASKEALKSVIAEVKNYVNPHEVALAEAQALPTVIGEEFENISKFYI